MKWLYRIIRLYRCPHFWVRQETGRIKDFDDNVIGYNIVMQCKRCGTVKVFKVTS